MLILQELTGQATFLENYVIDFDREAMILSHDGHGNPALAAKPADVTIKHSIYYQGVNGFGAGFEFAYAPGPVTNLALVNVGRQPLAPEHRRGRVDRHQARPVAAPQMLFKPKNLRITRLVRCLVQGRLAAPHGAGVRSPGRTRSRPMPSWRVWKW